MKLSTGFTILVLTLIPSAQVLAQASIPEDVRTKMMGYIGTWSYEEQVKETPMGPEKTITGTWEARWIYDWLIEWRGTSTADGVTSSSIKYEGYDPITQGYTYWFGSGGSRGIAYDGEWNGNTIQLEFVAFSPDGRRSRGRCIWPYSADFTALPSYRCEKLTNGQWWVFRTGTATKTGS